MQVETSELKDTALDYCIAPCEGYKPNMQPGTRGYGRAVLFPDSVFIPSTDWAQGGTIIEREKITIIETCGEWGAVCNWENNLTDAYIRNGDLWCECHPIPYWVILGKTPLIAAMKCYVQSKLGDTVDIPEELL